MTNTEYNPGPIVLFGSGETSPSGRRIFEQLFKLLPDDPKISLLETPAGFELNSDQVAGRIADFLSHHLQNYQPEISIIPARKRGTDFSPDDEKIAAPLLKADMIFAGPGSPTYAVKQLNNSLVWHYLLSRHRLGAALAFSSASVIALSTLALPVYEIYKVGEDFHWKPGLDFFAPYGLPFVFIPHWNNNDGGDELDTSRCFMGQARFEPMLEMLPGDQIVVGIDEHTALWIDCSKQCCQVTGLGTVTILQEGQKQILTKGDTLPFSDLMDCGDLDPTDGIPDEIWEIAQNALNEESNGEPAPQQQVLDLLEQRQSARERKDWGVADDLRDRITALGWEVLDTPDGPVVKKL